MINDNIKYITKQGKLYEKMTINSSAANDPMITYDLMRFHSIRINKVILQINYDLNKISELQILIGGMIIWSIPFLLLIKLKDMMIKTDTHYHIHIPEYLFFPSDTWIQLYALEYHEIVLKLCPQDQINVNEDLGDYMIEICCAKGFSNVQKMEYEYIRNHYSNNSFIVINRYKFITTNYNVNFYNNNIDAKLIYQYKIIDGHDEKKVSIIS